MVAVAVHGNYELDDNPARVDRDALWQFVSTEAYWARWRSRADVEQQLVGSWRVVGCYDQAGRMVGFARAVSDGMDLAYLTDVYVLAGHRGQGLGQAIVHELIDTGGCCTPRMRTICTASSASASPITGIWSGRAARKPRSIQGCNGYGQAYLAAQDARLAARMHSEVG